MALPADCHDGLCLVDLSVSAKLPVGVEVPYVIGSTALITLLVTVTNTKIGQYLPHPARDVKLNLPIEDSNNLVPAWYPEDCAIYKSASYRLVISCVFDLAVIFQRQFEFIFNATMVPANQQIMKWNDIMVRPNNRHYRDMNNKNNYADFSISLETRADVGMTSTQVLPMSTPYTMSHSGDAQNLTVHVGSSLNRTSAKVTHGFNIRNFETTPLQDAMVSVDIPTWLEDVPFADAIEGSLTIIHDDGKMEQSAGQCRVDSSASLNGIPSATNDVGNYYGPIHVNCTTYGIKCSILRCPPLTVLRQNMTVYLNVNANVNLEKFLAKYYSNHTSGNLTMTRDVIYTLGGHVRFEDSSKAPPLSMDLIPDHVYSSTTFVARRTADAHVLATVIVVSALALVFVSILVAQCVLISLRRRNVYYPGDQQQCPALALSGDLPPPPPVSPTLSKVDELHLMTPDREEILQLTEPLLLHPAQEMNKNPQVRFDFESSV